MTDRQPVGALVLTGGRSTRLGCDKAGATVDGVTLLDRTLDGLPVGTVVVCVGPEIATSRSVSWTREKPPFSGPMAAVEAGVAALNPSCQIVLILGADMPAAGRAVPTLLEALTDQARTDVAVVRDTGGRLQPLLSLWNRGALETRLQLLTPTQGRAVTGLLDGACVAEVTDAWGAATDIDTPHDLAGLRSAQDDRH